MWSSTEDMKGDRVMRLLRGQVIRSSLVPSQSHDFGLDYEWKSIQLPYPHWLEIGWSSFLDYTVGMWKGLEIDDSYS